jgi:superfamily II DNA or RNA helicase
MNIREHKQTEFTAHIRERKRTLLNVSIRLGKTKIALDAVDPFEKVLVVYPFTTILASWKEDMLKFPPNSSDFTFTTTRSLKKYAHTEWDYVIVDEPQELSPAQIEHLRTIRSKKLVGLSGTLSAKTVKELWESLKWPVGVTYTIGDAINDKLVKDYRIFIHYIHMDNFRNDVSYQRYGKTMSGTEVEAYNQLTQNMNWFKEKMFETKGTKDYFRYAAGYNKNMNLRTNMIYNSRTLVEYTQQVVQNYAERKALIYTTRIDIADKLSDISFHSRKKDESLLEEFKNADTGHLAVVDCVKAGITIKKLNTVIFHCYESNTESFFQKLGRSLLYEFEGEISTIHIMCLKGTQMETWISEACTSLEQEKIFYLINGKVTPKLQFHREQHPDKQLFLYKGKLVYFSRQDPQLNVDLFRFLGAEEKDYPISRKNLIAI